MIALPTRQIVFAANCTIAALAAVWISAWWNLPSPGWAALTVFISSQPLAGAAGAVATRAWYRFVGTAAGSVASLLLLPPLASTPELLVLALAAWTASCVYLSLVDRTARSYAFLLAGYTVAIVFLPLASVPDNLFDTVLSRVEEVAVGAACAALAHSLLFPRSVAAIADERLGRILEDARTAILRALLPAGGDPGTDGARARLAQGLAELHQLGGQRAADLPRDRAVPPPLHDIERALVATTVLLSAVEDRLSALGSADDLPPAVTEHVAAVSGWLRDAAQTGAGTAVEPPRAPEAALQALRSLPPAREALATSLLMRVDELVHSWRTAARLALGGVPASRHVSATEAPRRSLHVDHRLAAFAAARVGLTVGVAAAVVLLLGWQQGAPLVGVAAAASSVSAFLDNPRPFLQVFLRGSLLALPVAAIYAFGVLPALDSFGGLAFALAPLFFGSALYLASPKHWLPALAFTLSSQTLLSLRLAAGADLVAFSSLAVATIGGTVVSMLCVSLVGIITPSRGAQRIMDLHRCDLRRLLDGAIVARGAWASRLVDRVALLVPRVGGVPDHQHLRATVAHGLLGLNVIELRAYGATPRAAARQAVNDALDALAIHLRARRRTDGRDVSLEEAVDRATIAIATHESGALRMRALAAAAGLHRGIRALAQLKEIP